MIHIPTFNCTVEESSPKILSEIQSFEIFDIPNEKRARKKVSLATPINSQTMPVFENNQSARNQDVSQQPLARQVKKRMQVSAETMPLRQLLKQSASTICEKPITYSSTANLGS